MAAVYVFNLIVGTGALTIPSAFSHAGWILGIILVAILAFLSYITATFVIESMTASNAIIRWEARHKKLRRTSSTTDDVSPIMEEEEEDSGEYPASDEQDKLLEHSGDRKRAGSASSTYCFDKCVELGQMAGMFYNKTGLIWFYVTICVYLYGDLAIYAAAVSKTLRDVTCTRPEWSNGSSNGSSVVDGGTTCWSIIVPVNRNEAYCIFVMCFAVLLGPFVFYNVQKTKWLQMTTSLLRWTAFVLMVVLASVHLANSSENRQQPQTMDWSGLPNLFGVCVYSFMCHHSLPSIITPIVPKASVYRMMASNYVLVLGFYILLAMTAIFSFHHVHDLYTLNFSPNYEDIGDHDLPTDSAFVQYFLSLFPVFTLGTNFPIIAVTLRNNLRQLAASSGFFGTVDGRLGTVCLPLVAIVPPLAVALVTENLQTLVGFTGAFAGVGVQYVIPTTLLLLSRNAARSKVGATEVNPFASPFRHVAWGFFVLTWSVVCVALIVTNYLVHGLGG